MEDTDGGNSAARAFDDLRAEVSILRRAVESLPDGWKAAAPPDYTPSFGAISKQLQNLTSRLAAIESHPSLKMTPAQHQEAVANVGNKLMERAASQIDQATRASTHALEELKAFFGTVRSQDAQLKWLLVTGAALFVIGLLMSPFLARLLPFGLDASVAAIVMNADEWNAGQKLMQAVNPSAWAVLSAEIQIAGANHEALNACRDTATRTQKEQRCTINVAPGSAGRQPEPR